MLNHNGGSRTDTLVKLVLIFFISLLSFSIGTFVGKQFSDSQHKMASLEGEAQEADRSTASVDPKALDVEPEDALTEEDIANLEDEFVNNKKDDLAEVAQEATHDEIAKTEKTPSHETTPAESLKDSKHAAKAVEAVHAIAERVAEGKTPMERKVTTGKRLPSSMPVHAAADTVGKYTVQVSAHNKEGDAAKRAQELVSKGLTAFYVKGEKDGRTWYRVNVGLHTNMTDAKKARQQLIEEGRIAKDSIVKQIVEDQARNVASPSSTHQ